MRWIVTDLALLAAAVPDHNPSVLASLAAAQSLASFCLIASGSAVADGRRWESNHHDHSAPPLKQNGVFLPVLLDCGSVENLKRQ